MSTLLDLLFRTAPATSLVTNTGATVDVSAASPPTAGQILSATDATHATWQTIGAAVDATARAAAAAAQATADAAVPKALFDANTVLTADVDNTPQPITMAASTVLARLAAGNIKAASVAEMQALLQIDPANTAGAVPLYVPPASRGLSAGTLDDEFDSTTIGGSWVFRDTTTGPTNRTPNFGALTENTDLTGATTVPNVSLHTQGRRSHMLVQTTRTGPANYLIYKPFTWATGRFYYTRMGMLQREMSVNPGTGSCGFWMAADSAGVPDVNNRCFMSIDVGNPAYRWTTVSGGVSTTTQLAFNGPQSSSIDAWGTFHYYGIANAAGVLGASNQWYGEVFEDGGNRVASQPGGNGFTWTPAYIGFMWVQPIGKPCALSVDFIREWAGHPLLHM